MKPCGSGALPNQNETLNTGAGGSLKKLPLVENGNWPVAGVSSSSTFRLLDYRRKLKFEL